METVTDFIFLGYKITAFSYFNHEIKRYLLLGRKAMTNLDSIWKSRDITLPTKVHIVKAMVFSVVLYGCESWIIRTAECWRIDALELWYWRLLWIPCYKEINPVNPNGNQSWIFTGRIDAEAETPILWPPDAKILMLGKTEQWTQEEKGTTKDHWCNGHKFEQTPGDSEGQGSLACCNWRGHQESDRTEWLNNNFPFNPE